MHYNILAIKTLKNSILYCYRHASILRSIVDVQALHRRKALNAIKDRMEYLPRGQNLLLNCHVAAAAKRSQTLLLDTTATAHVSKRPDSEAESPTS